MLNNFTGAKVYLACGYTDLRRGIDGLATIIEQQFRLDPCSDALFLFCGRRDLKRASSNGRGVRTRRSALLLNSTAG